MSQPLLLVVDDETGVRQSLQMIFNKTFRVLEAVSADEAIQKVTDETPDVVLLDIVMPGADGLAVLKEMIARAIHYNSDRRSKPFVVVNCAALPDTLIESELFGYEKGAFTNASQKKVGRFELAHAGTLFLDEIGELNLGTQAKFLRAVEQETFTRLGGTDDIKVDVRVIAASNRDLEQTARAGEFRPALFYRVNVVSLFLPPLRERREDIALLLDHFLRLKAQEHSIAPKALSPEVVDFFTSYYWPGNIRELENLIERLTILTPHETVMLRDLPAGMRSTDHTATLKEDVLSGARPLSDAVDEFERELIVKALQRTGFNQTKAASLLGTSRRILKYRIEKLKIHDPNDGGDEVKLST